MIPSSFIRTIVQLALDLVHTPKLNALFGTLYVVSQGLLTETPLFLSLSPSGHIYSSLIASYFLSQLLFIPALARNLLPPTNKQLPSTMPNSIQSFVFCNQLQITIGEPRSTWWVTFSQHEYFFVNPKCLASNFSLSCF